MLFVLSGIAEVYILLIYRIEHKYMYVEVNAY